MNVKHAILRAILAGVMWAIAYRFVRRGFNPEIEDPNKYNADAIYGGFSVMSVNILLPVLIQLIEPILIHYFHF